MINAHTPEQVVEAYAHIIPGEHKLRWLKDRLADGRIPSKRLTRNVRVMTDKHIEKWLEGEEPGPVKKVEAEPKPQPAASVVSGLSRRSHARIVRSA